MPLPATPPPQPLWRPKRILLSGGGIRAVAHVGALEVLHERGYLANVKEYVGVSAGAFVALGLCIGFTLAEMKMVCGLFDFALIRNIEADAILEFPQTYGLDDGKNLLKLIDSLLRLRGLSTETTFEELAFQMPEKPRLRCFATDLCTCSQREFSLEKTPKIAVKLALRASMCLPCYFMPVPDPETGNPLIDGGLIHNFPLAFLPATQRRESLGLAFSYDHTQIEDITDITTFLQQILACLYVPRTRSLYEAHPANTIVIPCGEYPSWHFEASPAERENLMEVGKKAVETFLEGLEGKRPKPVRRWSVI